MYIFLIKGYYSHGLSHRVVFLDNKRYFTLSLFTQVYKWVPEIILLRNNLVMDYR